MSNSDRIAAQLDALANDMPELGIPTELEALSRAARDGDDIAGRLADELSRSGEWES